MKKSILIFLPLLFGAWSLSAQGGDFTIRISKKRHPYLEALDGKDTALLQWNTTARFIVRDADPRWIQSVTTTEGRIYRQDSILTVSIPDQLRSLLDSIQLVVIFRPSARTDTSVLYRWLYIRPNKKDVIRPPARRTGFWIPWRWNQRLMESYIYSGTRSQSVNIGKGNIAQTEVTDITYHDYDSPDTTARKFDSLKVSIRYRRRWQTFTSASSSLPPEAIPLIKKLQARDHIRIEFYYTDSKDKKPASKILDMDVRSRLWERRLIVIRKG